MFCRNESLSSCAKRYCFDSMGLLGVLGHFGSAKDHSEYLGSANDMKIVSGAAKDPINILIKQRSQYISGWQWISTNALDQPKEIIQDALC